MIITQANLGRSADAVRLMSNSKYDGDAINFYNLLGERDGIASCATLFKAFVGRFGFEAFACGEVDIAERDRTVFYIVDWPPRWRKFYRDSGLIERDPLIEALGRYRKPFTWSELRREHKLSDAGSEALRLIAEQGWTEGLAVPVSRGGSLYGLVSLAGPAKELAERERSLLCLVSEVFLSRLRSLGPPGAFPVRPAGLFLREIETIRLVGRGMSDAEIAGTLGVAPSTAHGYVEGGRRKLQAKSRAQMAVIALSLGVIDAS